jgi:hypothetical protein
MRLRCGNVGQDNRNEDYHLGQRKENEAHAAAMDPMLYFEHEPAVAGTKSSGERYASIGLGVTVVDSARGVNTRVGRPLDPVSMTA